MRKLNKISSENSSLQMFLHKLFRPIVRSRVIVVTFREKPHSFVSGKKKCLYIVLIYSTYHLFSIFVGFKVLILSIYVLQLTVGILYHLLMNYIDLNQLSLITYIDRVTQIKPQVLYLSEIRASLCCHQVYLSVYQNRM